MTDQIEAGDDARFQLRPCRDCGVPPGQFHQDGCSLEQCSACGEQRESCGEPFVDDPPPERLPWTGEDPGSAECREFGWYARPVPGGWIPCGEDEPLAMPDVNRLRVEARWDRDTRRFVRLAEPSESSPAKSY